MKVNLGKQVLVPDSLYYPFCYTIPIITSRLSTDIEMSNFSHSFKLRPNDAAYPLSSIFFESLAEAELVIGDGTPHASCARISLTDCEIPLILGVFH
jgi:hypothetical protein